MSASEVRNSFQVEFNLKFPLTDHCLIGSSKNLKLETLSCFKAKTFSFLTFPLSTQSQTTLFVYGNKKS